MGNMEVPGTCQLCQKVGSVRTCKLCGLLVCSGHFVSDAGACTRCMPSRGGTAQEDEPKNLPPLPDDAGDRLT